MDYQTKEERVADYLREAIISGRLARGERLKQAEIATDLGISITPVREALKLLEAEGYLTCKSHQGVRVALFDEHGLAEVRDLRLVLEDRLLRAAIPFLDKAKLTEIKAVEREFESAVKSKDRKAARGINYRFHRLIYSHSQMPQTLHFIQILWARYPFDLINAIDGRTQRAVEEHRALLRFIEAGDIESARAAMGRHIDQGWHELGTSQATAGASIERTALS